MSVQRTFDRAVRFDERSRDYPATIGLEDAPLRSYTWRCDAHLDQGQEGACVGFAWSHELVARPVVIHADADTAQRIYREAQKIDEWLGEDYSGTSVLAGAKTLQKLLSTGDTAIMPEYRWSFGVDDLVKTLGYRGPAVLGIDWLADMEEPDDKGFVRASGSFLGGHAILARGVKVVWRDKRKSKTFPNLDVEASYITLRNSWGIAWGDNGDCRVSVLDMSKLLERDGECCVPVIRSMKAAL